MNIKTAATVIGGVYLAQAVGILFAAEAIASGAFPGITDPGNELALTVGTLVHQAMAGIAFCTGVIMLSARNLGDQTGTILKGFAIGSVGILGVAAYHMTTQDVEPPIPLLVVMTGLAAYAWVAAARAEA